MPNSPKSITILYAGFRASGNGSQLTTRPTRMSTSKNCFASTAAACFACAPVTSIQSNRHVYFGTLVMRSYTRRIRRIDMEHVSITLRAAGAITLAAASMLGLFACGGPPPDANTLLRQAKATVDAAGSAHFKLTSSNVKGSGPLISGGEGD